MVPTTHSDELSALTAHLDSARTAVLAIAERVPARVAFHPGVPSGRTLAGLVADLTVSERYWFGFVFAGGAEETWRFGAGAPEGMGLDQIVSAYRDAIARSNDIIRRAPSLATPAVHPPFSGTAVNLAWVMTHMIEETARHAGHADILVEQAERAESAESA